jgi:hypothetical protein
MKLAIRIFAITVVIAGATAATVAPKTANAVASHQSATAHMPYPGCSHSLPCPAEPDAR